MFSHILLFYIIVHTPIRTNYAGGCYYRVARRWRRVTSRGGVARPVNTGGDRAADAAPALAAWRSVTNGKYWYTLKVRYRQSLPGFHAITGCDFNPAFFRKGKSKPYKTLKKYPEYQEAFKNFETDGEGDIDDDEAIDWSNSDEENENIDDNDEN
ncbi:hypothetical protein EVAR_6285_1 [Eumeta japonica]|uniref:Uncharacterized protein n=1 Tax=Eumeta variegata TaxID=151549 RepID=A0A4C1TBA7_EUMVA|nr:hypothetical protein EVAR_6285_1 [Eumeta japonica]